MSTFITLKSGLRVNTADIIQYCDHFQTPGKLWIEVRSTVEGENEKLEDMTPEELDALLSPASSPIVEAVVNLDNLKPGRACCFMYDGHVKYGVIYTVSFSESKEEPFIEVHSGGEVFTVWPKDGHVDGD